MYEGILLYVYQSEKTAQSLSLAYIDRSGFLENVSVSASTPAALSLSRLLIPRSSSSIVNTAGGCCTGWGTAMIVGQLYRLNLHYK